MSWRFPLISFAQFDVLRIDLKWITTFIEPVFKGKPQLFLMMKAYTSDAFVF